MLVVEHVDDDLLQILRPHVIPINSQAFNAQYSHFVELVLKHLQEESLNVRHLLY